MDFESIYNKTFSKNSDCLPSIEIIKQAILKDCDIYSNHTNLTSMYDFRDKYTLSSFPILTDDFFKALKICITELNINKIIELASGVGWFSFWCKKYDIPIKLSVDNKS